MSIVRAHRDDGIITKFGIFPDPVEQARQLLVHGVEDALIQGPLTSAPLVQWRPEWAMDVIGPEVDEEGFIAGLSPVDKAQSPVNKACGDL